MPFRIEMITKFEGGIFARAPAEIVRPPLARAIESSVIQIQSEVIKEINTPALGRRSPAFVTGALIQSISTEGPDIRGDVIEGKVFTNVKHGPVLEDGARPHTPPLKRIEFWASKNADLLDPTKARPVKGKGRISKAKRRQNEIRRFAFAVQQKLRRIGLQGIGMFERGLDASRNFIDRRFAQAEREVAEALE